MFPVLRLPFEHPRWSLGCRSRQQGQLTTEERGEAAAQRGPILAGNGEVTTEVEEGLLVDLGLDGMEADQAMANIWVIVERPCDCMPTIAGDTSNAAGSVDGRLPTG